MNRFERYVSFIKFCVHVLTNFVPISKDEIIFVMHHSDFDMMDYDYYPISEIQFCYVTVLQRMISSISEISDTEENSIFVKQLFHSFSSLTMT